MKTTYTVMLLNDAGTYIEFAESTNYDSIQIIERALIDAGDTFRTTMRFGA